MDAGHHCGVFILFHVTTWCKSSMLNILSPPSQTDFVKYLFLTGIYLSFARWWWNYKTVFHSFGHRCFSVDKPKTAYFTYQTEESFYERLLFLDIFVIAKYQHMHLIFVVSRSNLCSATGNLMEFFQSCLRTSSMLAMSSKCLLFTIFIYKVDNENCCAYNSNVAINVTILITSLLFSVF